MPPPTAVRLIIPVHPAWQTYHELSITDSFRSLQILSPRKAAHPTCYSAPLQGEQKQCKPSHNSCPTPNPPPPVLNSSPTHTPYTTRRVSPENDPPDFYDTRLDSVRPRTVGYSPGHVRALSPTPCLTWGGRESSRISMEWGEGTGGSLGTVKACLRGTSRCGGSTTRPSRSCPVRGGYTVSSSFW